MSISILILTLNEEANIRSCLESVSWSDDIVVVDSGSNDRTIEIAQSLGARIIHKKLINWSEHQNWINENVNFKHDWIYYSDADEIVTPELKEELLEISRSSRPEVAYRLRYKNYFLGKWLRWSGGYPIWVLRFFRPEYVRWERLVNPRPIVSGVEGRLNSHFLHFSFNKGFEAWFDKHNKYSSDEAVEAARSTSGRFPSLRNILSPDAAIRRGAIKEASFFLPARGMLRFLYQYFFRLGFLDGYAGFHWSVMMGIYEYMIDLKVMEIKMRRRGLRL